MKRPRPSRASREAAGLSGVQPPRRVEDHRDRAVGQAGEGTRENLNSLAAAAPVL